MVSGDCEGKTRELVTAGDIEKAQGVRQKVKGVGRNGQD
jgi:hypothetical protein